MGPLSRSIILDIKKMDIRTKNFLYIIYNIDIYIKHSSIQLLLEKRLVIMAHRHIKLPIEWHHCNIEQSVTYIKTYDLVNMTKHESKIVLTIFLTNQLANEIINLLPILKDSSSSSSSLFNYN